MSSDGSGGLSFQSRRGVAGRRNFVDGETMVGNFASNSSIMRSRVTLASTLAAAVR